MAELTEEREQEEHDRDDSPARRTDGKRRKATLLEKLFGNPASALARVPITVTAEVENYEKELQSMQLDLNSNPLDFWRGASKDCPLLGKLARQLLAVPATSCPSERLFSAAGCIVTKRRAALTATHAEQIISLHEWSRFKSTESSSKSADVLVDSSNESSSSCDSDTDTDSADSGSVRNTTDLGGAQSDRPARVRSRQRRAAGVAVSAAIPISSSSSSSDGSSASASSSPEQNVNAEATDDDELALSSTSRTESSEQDGGLFARLGNLR